MRVRKCESGLDERAERQNAFERLLCLEQLRHELLYLRERRDRAGQLVESLYDFIRKPGSFSRVTIASSVFSTVASTSFFL